MENPLISVIIPIYQIDRYVGSCIESVMNQTYKNLEIILVDVGSEDRGAELCDLYAKKDSRIKVIHKKNGGLVSARKAGVKIATGEYVGYVDGDDWVDEKFYEIMVKSAIQYNSDLVVAGFSRDLFSTSTKISNEIPAGDYEGERLDRLKKNMFQFEAFSRVGVTTYVWNKLFKCRKLFDCQMNVDDAISIGEDAAVVYPYIMLCERVNIIDNFGYHYRQREDSMLKRTVAYSKETIGLNKLYMYLMNCTKGFPKKFEYEQQIRDFILGICIMRSGGVLKEVQQNFSPYDGEFYNSDIIVYSAGTFGQQLVRRIEENNYCNIVGWVDEDYREYRRCCLNVDPIEMVDFHEFDYILLATVDSTIAEKIKSRLIWRGIQKEKILTVDCPEERRTYLLKQYLSM